MAMCANPNCRRSVDPSWAFCPVCGSDNRAPRNRHPIAGCTHVYMQQTSFCRQCGQPLAQVSPPPPQVTPPIGQGSIPHSPVATGLPAGVIAGIVALVCIVGLGFVVGFVRTVSKDGQEPAKRIARSQPPLPSPSNQLRLGMSEAEARLIMGSPWSREVLECYENPSEGCARLEWPYGLGEQWRASCSANFSPDGKLTYGTYITRVGECYIISTENGKWEDAPGH
jgi:hypothetical protein